MKRSQSEDVVQHEPNSARPQMADLHAEPSAALDTSGAILPSPLTEGPNAPYRWSDLDPFTQGCVEALFARDNGAGFAIKDKALGVYRPARFSDLAPETLARIMEDCARFAELFGEWPLRDHGKHFWIGRQKDKHPDFPPLTVALNDDGKVMLRAVGSYLSARAPQAERDEAPEVISPSTSTSEVG